MKTKEILAVVGLIALIGFGVVPMQQQAADAERQNEKLFKKKQRQIEEVAKLEKIVQGGTQEGYIPDTPDELGFAKNIVKIAEKNGINTPKNWDFKINHNSDVGAKQISVSFPIQGRRQQIANFLRDLENNLRFMGVKEFSIQTDNESSLGLTKMNVEIYGFFLGIK